MWVVPRLPPLEPDGDEAAPDLSSPRLSDAAILAGVVAVSALALWRLPPATYPLWFPYLGAGGALVWVDFKTTWLPRRLHWIASAELVAGATIATALSPKLVLGVVAGAVAGFAVLWVVWRLAGQFGFGDVRLGLLVGAVSGSLGVSGWLASLLAGTIVGASWGIGHALRGRADTPFPYGPSLWLGPLLAAAFL